MASHNLFIKRTGLNLVDLAVRDTTTAAKLLRKPQSGVLGLDCRELSGGAAALRSGEGAFDTYLGALDVCLRNAGLRNRGFIIHRKGA